MVSGGRLNYAGGTDFFPTNGLFRAKDFVLQFDYLFGKGQTITLRFHVFPEKGEVTSYFNFSISISTESSGSQWKLYYYNIHSGEGEQQIASGYLGNHSGFNTIRFIIKQNNLLVFNDDSLFADIKDLNTLDGSENHMNSYYWNQVFDNIKFWNLDGVDLNP